MTGGIDRYIRCDLNVFTDTYFADVEDGEVVVCEKVLADLDVVSVVTEEGRLYVDVVTAFAEDVLYEPVLFFGIAGLFAVASPRSLTIPDRSAMTDRISSMTRSVSGTVGKSRFETCVMMDAPPARR